jgi:hypothetical protein
MNVIKLLAWPLAGFAQHKEAGIAMESTTVQPKHRNHLAAEASVNNQK